MKTCTPLDAASLLRRVLAGDVEGATCALCLCEESLLPPTFTIRLGCGQDVAVAELVGELGVLKKSEDLLYKKICSRCVHQLKNFYLFKQQCLKAMASLDCLVNIVDEQSVVASAELLEILANDPEKSFAESNINSTIDLDKVYRWNISSHECPKCWSNFKTLEQLSTHQKEHGRLEDYLCRSCNDTFNECQDFIIHWMSNHPTLPAPTHLKVLQNNSRLSPELIEKDEKTICVLCSTIFPCNADLAKHICAVDSIQAGNHLEVLDQNLKETSKKELRGSLFMPVNEPPRQTVVKHFVCQYCKNTYAYKKSLDSHIFKIHERLKTCDGCEKDLPIHEYEDHSCRAKSSKIIVKPETESCVDNDNKDSSDDWFKTYFTEDSRSLANINSAKHSRSSAAFNNKNIDLLRNDSGVFECRKCYSDFKTINKWSLHQKVHGKSPYYHCRPCDKTFNGFSSLIKHFAYTHPDLPQPAPIFKMQVSQNRQCICDYCKKTLKNKQCLIFHMCRQHIDKLKSYVCTICSTSYVNSHLCRYSCRECSSYPCIHEKYLHAHIKAEKQSPKSKHKCIDCDYVYMKKHDLLDHVNRRHLLNFPHMCTDCGKRCPSKRALRMHSLYSHLKKCCPYCNKPLLNNRLKTHMAECKLLEKPFACDLCTQIFATKEMSEKHREWHTTTVISCESCPFKCRSHMKLKNHRTRCHGSSTGAKKEKGSVEIEPTSFPCLKCTMDFEIEEECIEHEVSHSVEVEYLCRGCNQTFPTKAERFECARTHKGESTEVCPICGRLFQKNNLQVHLKRHAMKGETSLFLTNNKRNVLPKTHMCDICGSMHSTAINMKRHKETHKPTEKCGFCFKLIEKPLMRKHLATHGDGPKRVARKPKLSCLQCPFTTVYRHMYEAHLNRVHRAVKPYECEVCAKMFYSKPNLMCHMRGSHSEVTQTCIECNLTFRSSKGFRLHMMKHRGELPYACEHCDLKFVSASRKKEHQDRAHFGPQYQCTICDKAFTRGLSLRNHLLVIHQGEKARRRIPSKAVFHKQTPEEHMS